MPPNNKEEWKFKRGDKVFWVVKVNGIRRKYEGTVLLRISGNKKGFIKLREVNKKRFVSSVFDLTVRKRGKRKDPSYIVVTENTDGEKVLHWPIGYKLQSAA